MNSEIAGLDRPRVCAVSYLNTVPLVWGMLHGEQRDRFQLEFQIPSMCADRMRIGAADVGILPSIEVARQRLEAIPGIGIACRGPVRSILLISRVRPAQIRTLAADTSSRTSVMLARVLLSRKYGVEPEFIPMRPELEPMLGVADAALIIGDPALRIDPGALPFTVLDLGQEWLELTGLPMVFAVWGCRKEFVTPELTEAFLGSCSFGLAHIDEIARNEGPARGISEELARAYFRHNVMLELDSDAYEGMRLFLNYAAQFDTLVATGNPA